MGKWRTNVKAADSEAAAQHAVWSCHLFSQNELPGHPTEPASNTIRGLMQRRHKETGLAVNLQTVSLTFLSAEHARLLDQWRRTRSPRRQITSWSLTELIYGYLFYCSVVCFCDSHEPGCSTRASTSRACKWVFTPVWRSCEDVAVHWGQRRKHHFPKFLIQLPQIFWCIVFFRRSSQSQRWTAHTADALVGTITRQGKGIKAKDVEQIRWRHNAGETKRKKESSQFHCTAKEASTMEAMLMRGEAKSNCKLKFREDPLLNMTEKKGNMNMNTILNSESRNTTEQGDSTWHLHDGDTVFICVQR